MKGDDAPPRGAVGALAAPSTRGPITTSKKETLGSYSLLFTRIIAAVAQYITASIALAGKQYTPQALAAVFQSVLKSQADLEAARAAVTAAQQARDAALAEAVATLPSLRQHVAAAFGEASTAFAAFGFSAHKAPAKSAEAKAKAATKAAATRKAHRAALAAVDAPGAQPAPLAPSPAPAAAPPASPAAPPAKS